MNKFADSEIQRWQAAEEDQFLDRKSAFDRASGIAEAMAIRDGALAQWGFSIWRNRSQAPPGLVCRSALPRFRA